MTDALTKDWPHGYVDSDGDRHEVRYWGRNVVITTDDDDRDWVWGIDGETLFASCSPLTLRNAPAPKRSGWLVVWLTNLRDAVATTHDTESDARSTRAEGWARLAVLPWTEGDGL